MAFFETPVFPDDISYGSAVTNSYKTDIETTEMGNEARYIRWADARRSYNAAFGVRTQPQLEALVNFFHSCKGKGHGFRFRDPIDYKSCAADAAVLPTDQIILPITGSTTVYQLRKRYNAGTTVYRDITKPRSGTVVVAVGGVPVSSGFTINHVNGQITFTSAPGGTVTAGFLFDVPCRFDTDQLNVELFNLKVVKTDVPIVEIRV